MPLFREKDCKRDMPVEDILDDIDQLFQIFDFIEWIQLVGGEIFLYKNLDKIFDHLLKYRKKFSKLILMTNATIKPKAKEMELLQQYGNQCQVMISDYGQHSCAKKELIESCRKNDIPYQVKTYHGDLQYYDGWIDNNQFSLFDGSEEQLLKKILKCPQISMQNMHCMWGKLYMCSNALFMSELGVSQPESGDVIDLNDDTMTIDQKREIIRQFYHKPAAACHICAFKDADVVERYPAAKQIEKKQESE